MAAQALATIEQPVKPRRKQRMSAKVRHLVDVLVSGKARTQVQAASMVLLTPESVSRALRRQDVRSAIEKGLANNVDRASLKASVVLNDLLDHGSSEHVKAKLAEFALGLAGYAVARQSSPVIQNNISIRRTIINGQEHEVITGFMYDLSPPAIDHDHIGSRNGSTLEQERSK
jgi:hypothetical protein